MANTCGIGDLRRLASDDPALSTTRQPEARLVLLAPPPAPAPQPHLNTRTARETFSPLLLLVNVAKSSHWKGTPPVKNSCRQPCKRINRVIMLQRLWAHRSACQRYQRCNRR